MLTDVGLPLRVLTIKTQIDENASEAQRIERLLQIANEVVGFVKDFKVHHVGIEDYAYSRGWQAHQIGEVGGVVKTQLWLACGIVARPAGIKSARKHVLGYGGSFGKGKEAKENIVRVVRDGYGVDVDNDHEADSFVVARYTFDSVVAEEREAKELWEKKQPTS